MKNTMNDILVEWKSSSAKLFKDLKWLGGVHCLSSIFKELNKLNVSMQGKGGDIFLFNEKTTAMKEKLTIWIENLKSGNCSNFLDL